MDTSPNTGAHDFLPSAPVSTLGAGKVSVITHTDNCPSLSVESVNFIVIIKDSLLEVFAPFG